MKRPKFTSARARTELIADYPYGVDVYADVSQEERENAKTIGDDESYPIDKCTGDGPSVESAIHAVGRGSGDHDAIRRHIMKCAGELKCSNLIPDNWAEDGSIKEESEGALADAPDADVTTDSAVAAAIKSAIADVKKAIAAQAEDPDADDPDDKKVLAELEASLATLEAATEAQGEDVEEDQAPSNGAQKDAESDGYAAQETCSMCDGTGKLEDKECPQCEGTGKVPVPDDENSAGEMRADLAIPGAPLPGTPDSPPAEEGGAAADLNEPPAMPDNDAVMGPQFTIPVAIIEGQPTGDGRSIAVGALDWRTPPLPLMLLATATHDPMGMDSNAPAVLAGRIDSLERVPGEGDTQIITAKGFCLNDENGLYLASLCEQMGRLGVSADVAVEESSIEVTDVDEIGFPVEMNDELTKGTIMAVTACPMPAFEGAYMVMGDGAEVPDAIPQQTEEEPMTAAAPHYLTYASCEPCEAGFDSLVASGGPARPPKAWFEDPHFTEGDGRLQRILSSDGEEQWACPLTVDEDGRVYGHIAPWGVCHTGKPGCITAPPSPSGYALFMRGQLTTAEGEKIRVGTITADTGHAPTSGISSMGAMGHYDNTAFGAADVVAGEDEYGIWVAGATRPSTNEAQTRKLTAGSISGDWRRFGGELDLIAALAVPMPGFPIAVVDHGERLAMVAAGGQIMAHLKQPAPPAEDRALAPSVRRTLLGVARRDARERIEALR